MHVKFTKLIYTWYTFEDGVICCHLVAVYVDGMIMED